MHVRAADLVHEQHEDEAQDQRDSDAGVKLLVAVFVFDTSAESCCCFCISLCLGHLHHSGLALSVMSCIYREKENTLVHQNVVF